MYITLFFLNILERFVIDTNPVRLSCCDPLTPPPPMLVPVP